MSTWVPGSAVPLKVGLPPWKVWPGVGPVTTGVTGGTGSAVRVTGAETGEALPAASIAWAVRVVGVSPTLWRPPMARLPSRPRLLTDQLPMPSARVLPKKPTGTAWAPEGASGAEPPVM